MQFNIVADENMPNVEPWFAPFAKSIRRVAGRTLTASALKDADVLLVRSITQVNKHLLSGTPVKFVGSATIGTDHIDQSFLKQQSIPLYHAPGCNAQSVVDWLLSVLCRLHIEHELNWSKKVVGVIGVGHVGSKVANRLKQFGTKVLVCDPVKNANGELPEHIDIESLLSQSDIVCVHAPHTRSGDYPTHQMLNADRLSLMPKNSWLINAGRGPVTEESALLEARVKNALNVVLDVWPNEPNVNVSLLEAVHLASPHVAGYSLEGKFKGTEMLARAFAKEFGLTSIKSVPLPTGVTVDARLFEKSDVEQWASEIVLALYDPARDTAVMRFSAGKNQLDVSTFDALRKEYPTRREIASTAIAHAPKVLEDRLKKFGFTQFK
ncbi:4-phosphoerythronate dehydrogenase [Reinekea forsetii]|nr:4-phosphoerythronate dehydrogenase [Reinekea forsetii]